MFNDSQKIYNICRGSFFLYRIENDRMAYKRSLHLLFGVGGSVWWTTGVFGTEWIVSVPAHTRNVIYTPTVTDIAAVDNFAVVSEKFA